MTTNSFLFCVSNSSDITQECNKQRDYQLRRGCSISVIPVVPLKSGITLSGTSLVRRMATGARCPWFTVVYIRKPLHGVHTEWISVFFFEHCLLFTPQSCRFCHVSSLYVSSTYLYAPAVLEIDI